MVLLKNVNSITTTKKNGIKFLSSLWTGPIIVILALYALSNSQSFASISMIRYLIYLTPLIFVGAYLCSPSCRDETKNSQRKYVIFMLFSFFVPALLSKNMDYQYIVFMWLGFLPFAFPLRLKDSFVIHIFYACIFCQFIVSAAEGFSFKGVDANSFSSGSASLTHTLPGMFGILLGPLIKMRRYKLVFFCVAMIMLAGKRSALSGSIIGIVMMSIGELILRLLGKENKGLANFIVIVPFVTLSFIVMLNAPQIYEQAASYFNVSPDLLSSGRYTGQSLAYASIFSADIPTLLFGQGLGQADNYGARAWNNLTPVLHNDYLRLLVDFGIISGFLYIFCLTRLIGGGAIGVYLATYASYVWITENTMISVMGNILYFIISSAPLSTRGKDST